MLSQNLNPLVSVYVCFCLFLKYMYICEVWKCSASHFLYRLNKKKDKYSLKCKSYDDTFNVCVVFELLKYEGAISRKRTGLK